MLKLVNTFERHFLNFAADYHRCSTTKDVSDKKKLFLFTKKTHTEELGDCLLFIDVKNHQFLISDFVSINISEEEHQDQLRKHQDFTNCGEETLHTIATFDEYECNDCKIDFYKNKNVVATFQVYEDNTAYLQIITDAKKYEFFLFEFYDLFQKE